MKEQKEALKQSFLNIIDEGHVFAENLEQLRDKSSLFVIGGLEEDNNVKAGVLFMGDIKELTERLIMAMAKEESIADCVMNAAKFFALKQTLGDAAYEVISKFIDNKMGEIECNCPKCQERREREKTRKEGN